MKKLLESSKEAVWNYAQEIAKEYDLILHSAPIIKYERTVCGVGYCSDPDLPAKINGKDTEFYVKWVNMMNRAYNPNSKYYRPYDGVTVCEEWHDRAVFTKWMKSREWEDCELDKDLLEPGNKEYGPHTCCFIPGSINSLIQNTLDKLAPVGVYQTKSGNYEVWINSECISSHITYEEAKRNWLLKKAEYIEPRISNDNVRTEQALRKLVYDLRAEAKKLDEKQNLFTATQLSRNV